ncbi:IpaB/EvcA family protein [Weissella diestrammenae]|uniref:IpaB/EvcA family protein n=1 Tax=Weissella diestrammenae TaxID=1162633 RepID=A0A7G9T795_9LACO|nr:IpaB/EvcA family protein [Weissella diestrammenae]MCM0582425.1 IpaB/EvcA family protein [Weissella diestrammenae]QNN75970.1 IpaB/EvcA family protein [Weissella diestrammenae]
MIFSKATQQLLAQLNQIYPGSVILRGQDTKSGVITANQVTTDMLGTRLMIEVNDATAPDFLATREMLMMLLTLNGYPQAYFQLITKDEAITEQLMVMSTYLYQPALHAIVYREQVKHNVLTPDVVTAYTKGVIQTLTKENDSRDEAALRLLTLIDAKVLMGAVPFDVQDLSDTFVDYYPEAWAAAELIYDQMSAEHIKDPFTVHQAITTLFKAFDAQMIAWNLPELHNQEFTTITPVISKEQAQLPVSEVFGIRHVDLLKHDSKATAFVGELKDSGQNSFVVNAPSEDPAAFFKALYALPVEELFSQLKQPFTIK